MNFRSPGQASRDDATVVTSKKGEPVTDRELALMHLYRALNLQQHEIAELLGRNQSAVANRLADAANRVRDGEDPVEVYEDIMAPLADPLKPSGGEEQ